MVVAYLINIYRPIKRHISSLFVSVVVISTSDCSNPTEVALTTFEGHKGQAAVEKLTDQSVLTKVALEANSWITRRDAVRRLTDQSTLTKIALDTIQDFNVREVAVGKLTD